MTDKRKIEECNDSEKPVDWKDFKRQKKELTLKRKQKNKLYDVNTESKKIYEQFKPKVIKGGNEKRAKLIAELHSKLKNNGNYAKHVLSHDMARVVQCMLKYASNEIREEIANELIVVIPQMFISKYGVHCVQTLLKYGSGSVKTKVVSACYSNVVKLSSHIVSANVLDYAYQNCTSALQKKHFVQEFFSDIYKQSKDDSVNHLRDTFKNAESLKTAILSATKLNLSRILNKQLLDLTLVHTVMIQYLEECSTSDRDELVNQLFEHIVVISNSNDGARVAMRCIWFSNNKNRKVIMKNLKESLKDLCCHEFGHLTILALLDSIDDTVLLNKIILQTIISDVLELIANEYGRKILMWLVSPFDKMVFNPNLLAELEKGRMASMSKKEPEIRRNEIKKFVLKPLIENISKNFDLWFLNTQHALVTFNILKQDGGDDLEMIYNNLSKLITSPTWQVKIKESDEKTIYGIEHTGFHIILKKLIDNDAKNEFKNYLSEHLNDKVLKIWIGLNRGCFLLTKMIENFEKWNNGDFIKKLKSNMTYIQNQTNAGSKALCDKLNSLS